MIKNTWRMLFMAVMVLMLAAACTPDAALLEPAGQADGSPELEDAGQAALEQSDQAYAGEMVTTSDAGPGESDQAYPGETTTANVAGSGEVEPGYPGETTAYTDPAVNATGPGPGTTGEGAQAVNSEMISGEGNVSDPGAGEDGAAAGNEEPGLQPQAGGWLPYRNETYAFSLEHPAGYQLRALDAGTAASSDPVVAYGVDFISPENAASEVAEMEIPELSVRIYAAESLATLAEWMASVSLDPATSGETVTVYTNPYQEGVQVCSTADFAPNCRIYFYGNGWVYELTPFGLAGEALAQTFRAGL